MHNKPSEKKNDNLFNVKPTFFNPKKETDQPLFKELDEKGDLYTHNLKIKGLLDANKKNEEDYTIKNQTCEITENYDTSKSVNFNKDYGNNFKNNYSKKNNNYNKKNKINHLSTNFNPESHVNYTSSKSINNNNFINNFPNESVWNEFDLIDNEFDIERQIEGDHSYRPNNYSNRKNYHVNQKFYDKSRDQLNLDNPKNDLWEGLNNRDMFNLDTYSNNETPIVKKTTSEKEVRKVIILVK